MPTFEELFSVFKDLLPLLTAGGAVATLGMAPRIGPGRAAWIAIRSRFAFKPNPESLRAAVVKDLKSKLTDKDFGQGYLVVTGEKGVGKTCLVNTVTSKIAGVVSVVVQPGDNHHAIIKDALEKLADPPFKFMNAVKSAIRVIFWHRIFTLGRSPIVVINAKERPVGEKYAGLAAAVRTLVDDYKLRVIVDGSSNSLDETLLRTTREDVIEIKPMTKDMVWQIDQLKDLFDNVKKANLDDTVFGVLGGIPSKYESLWRKVKTDLQNGKDAKSVIGSYLCSQIFAAIKLIEDACGDNEKSISLLLKLFNETDVFTKKLLVANNLARPALDEVFREVEKNNARALLPASNAISIVLQHRLTKKPSLNELQELLNIKA